MGVLLLVREEFELVIMIGVAIEEMHGSDREDRLELISGEPNGWYGKTFHKSEMAALLGEQGAVCKTKCLTTPAL